MNSCQHLLVFETIGQPSDVRNYRASSMRSENCMFWDNQMQCLSVLVSFHSTLQ